MRNIHWFTALGLAALIVGAGSLSLWQQGHLLVCHGESREEVVRQHAHGVECTHVHAQQPRGEQAGTPCCRCECPHQHDLPSFVCVAGRHRSLELPEAVPPQAGMSACGYGLEDNMYGPVAPEACRLLTLDFNLQCKRTVCLIV